MQYVFYLQALFNSTMRGDKSFFWHWLSDVWQQSKDSCSFGLNSVSKIYLNRTR